MSNEMETSRLTPNAKKGIVAGLLAVVLVGVIVMQRSMKPINDSADGGVPVCDSGYVPPVSIPNQVPKEAMIDQPPLPLADVDLDLILAHDPFRCQRQAQYVSSTSVKNDVTSDLETKGERGIEEQAKVAPIEIPVSAIVMGDNGASVLIGNALYRENDQLEGGWQIVAIKSNSILVRKYASDTE